MVCGTFYIAIKTVCYAVDKQIKYGSQQFGTTVARYVGIDAKQKNLCVKVDDMSQENKIDFTKSPADFFYSMWDTDTCDEECNLYGPLEIFYSTYSDNLDNPDFDRIVLFIVTIAYMRMNSTNVDNQFHIPAGVSLDTLSYIDEQNFFKELFIRFKVICIANEVLGETATILEPYFMAGADKLARENTDSGCGSGLIEVDWSESGFGKRHSCMYVRDDLMWWSMYYDKNYRANLVKELHHLAPLLNIQPEEKLLCSPFLYITYLANLFEQSGWETNDCVTLAKTYLNKVTAVQFDPVLWAIQTLQVVLFGCNKQLISAADVLSSIYNKVENKVEDGFDVIFLPEAREAHIYDYFPKSIPDVGQITIGNIVIEAGRALHRVAFLYNLLNDKGRMFVSCDGVSPQFGKNTETTSDSEVKLLAFFVDNNLIEAIIQTENCLYMLIDKNRPATRHGKVLFYYRQDFEYAGRLLPDECHYPQKNEKIALSIEENTCENVKLRHDEGAVIVSNNEIRLNDYCLLPKKYIYDFDRITANAEFQVVRHIAHDLSPKLSTVDTVLKHLNSFIASHELLLEPLQEQFYEGQTLEPVGEAIDKARSDISQMHKLIKDTRKVITDEIPLEDFSSVNLRDFLEATKKKYANGNITLEIDCDQDIQYEMHETSFAEMIDNFVRNADIHGFVNGGKRPECKIAIVVTKRKNDPNLIVEIKNNGNPLPDELTVEKFTEFGNKGKSSPGEGLGGNSIYKVIRAHRGNLEIIRNDKEYPVNFKITLPNPEVNK